MFKRKRVTSGRRRAVKRRRTKGAFYKRRTYKKRGTRNVLTIKRRVQMQSWQISTVTTNNFCQQFTATLQDVPNYTQYVDMFDRYRIAGVKWTFQPRFTDYTNAATVAPVLQAHMLTDPFAPSVAGMNITTYSRGNLNTFLEHGNTRTYRTNRPFSCYMRAYTPDDINAVADAKRIRFPLTNVSNVGRVAQGPTVFVSEPNLTGNFGSMIIDVYATFYLQFRGLR